MIRGFWHVSFTVRDLDAAVKWYTEVLGLEYVRGQVQHNEYTASSSAIPKRISKSRSCACRRNHSHLAPSY